MHVWHGIVVEGQEPQPCCLYFFKAVSTSPPAIFKFTVFTRLISLGNYFFNPSVAWGIIRERGIIRGWGIIVSTHS